MFAQQTKGGNTWKARENCHNCGKKGHIAGECPKRKQAGKDVQIHANTQHDVSNEDDIYERENIFVQNNKNWLLLDSQSTVDQQVANPALLKNIRKAASVGTVRCNPGSTSINLEGDLGNVTKNHNPHSIADIVS
jgi:hypothetical protein